MSIVGVIDESSDVMFERQQCLFIGNGFVTNEQALFIHPGSSQLTDHCATSHRGGKHLCCQAMIEFCLANLNFV
jgi:hypothetical protein